MNAGGGCGAGRRPRRGRSGGRMAWLGAFPVPRRLCCTLPSTLVPSAGTPRLSRGQMTPTRRQERMDGQASLGSSAVSSQGGTQGQRCERGPRTVTSYMRKYMQITLGQRSKNFRRVSGSPSERDKRVLARGPPVLRRAAGAGRGGLRCLEPSAPQEVGR